MPIDGVLSHPSNASKGPCSSGRIFVSNNYAGLDGIFCMAIALWVIRTRRDMMKVPFCDEHLEIFTSRWGVQCHDDSHRDTMRGKPCLQNSNHTSICSISHILYFKISRVVVHGFNKDCRSSTNKYTPTISNFKSGTSWGFRGSLHCSGR